MTLCMLILCVKQKVIYNYFVNLSLFFFHRQKEHMGICYIASELPAASRYSNSKFASGPI